MNAMNDPFANPRQPFTPVWVALVFEGPTGRRAYRGRMLAGELEAVTSGRRKSGFVQLEDVYWLEEEGRVLEPLRASGELPEAEGSMLVPLAAISALVPLREEVVRQLQLKFAFTEASQLPPRSADAIDEEVASE